MCGIVGSYSFSTAATVQRNTLEQMRDVMTHRGPDGSGVWLSPDGKIGLGHRRLAIVDLSAAASQPLCNEDGSIWVTFNGEIYNHLKLRKKLVGAGHMFKTDHSDTEVIVHGYEQWGIDGLLKEIEGDFAIGLWDGRHRRLYLIRDRIGVKPLYFTINKGVLHFASEIKALLRHPSISPKMDIAAMRHYLTFLTTPAPLTMFEGIYKLPAGQYLTVTDNGSVSVRRYWDALPGQSGIPGLLRSSDSSVDEAMIATEVRSRLRNAVEKRVMADVPLGVMLSGGIDSTTNVAMMAEMLDRPVETFTVGYRDYPELNETAEARKIAEIYRTNHHEALIEKRDMAGYIDDLVHAQDEPLADWVCIPLHFVSKLARDSGVVVVQVGEGSDEQFVGYNHYFNYASLNRKFWQPYLNCPDALRFAAASGAARLAAVFPGFDRHADFLERAAKRRELFWSGSAVYWDVYKRKLLTSSGASALSGALNHEGSDLVPAALFSVDTHDVVKALYAPFDSHGLNSGFMTRMIYNEFKLRLPELLLMRVDKIMMSVSLEARVPFLDHNLVNLTMDLSDFLRVGNNRPKHLLKRAVSGLIPDSTINRKKVGFDAPMTKWLREDFGRHVESSLLSSSLVKNGTFNRDFICQLFVDQRAGKERAILIWVLFNLVEWHRFWIE